MLKNYWKLVANIEKGLRLPFVYIYYILVHILHRGAFYRFRLPSRRMRFQSSLIRDKNSREENVFITLKIKRLYFSFHFAYARHIWRLQAQIAIFIDILSASASAQFHENSYFIIYRPLPPMKRGFRTFHEKFTARYRDYKIVYFTPIAFRLWVT